MDEELVQNGVMHKKIVKNFAVDANFGPKVVMDLSKFKIGGWNSLQPSNQKLLNEFTDKNDPWLLIGISNRDPFFVTQFLERHSASSDQHMKKLMSLREGLHAMMQCYMRQHFADFYWLHEHPGGHASWREPTMKKFTKESTTYFVKGLVCNAFGSRYTFFACVNASAVDCAHHDGYGAAQRYRHVHDDPDCLVLVHDGHCDGL